VCEMSVLPDDLMAEGRLPHWAKVLMIGGMYEGKFGFDWIMWMDADAIFFNFTATLMHHIDVTQNASGLFAFDGLNECTSSEMDEPVARKLMAKERQGTFPYPNSGVFFMKSHSLTWAFLIKWYFEQNPIYYRRGTADNDGLFEALIFHPSLYTSLSTFWCGHPFNHHAAFISFFRTRPLVIHFMGLGTTKYLFLYQWISKCDLQSLSLPCQTELIEYKDAEYKKMFEQFDRNLG
jgi:hypothetical protein